MPFFLGPSSNSRNRQILATFFSARVQTRPTPKFFCLGQLVERETGMPEVGGWNPTGGSKFFCEAREVPWSNLPSRPIFFGCEAILLAVRVQTRATAKFRPTFFWARVQTRPTPNFFLACGRVTRQRHLFHPCRGQLLPGLSFREQNLLPYAHPLPHAQRASFSGKV